jgi:hypothetical protein
LPPRMDVKIYTLCNHVVAFLDVLGQREKFRQLQLPKTPAEQLAVQEVLRDTVGFVSSLRDEFRLHFESFEAGVLKPQSKNKKLLQPHFVGFSDSFVASVSLKSDDQYLTPVITILSTLSAACHVMLTSLARSHALRGGIDVGLATEITPGEIYGTALERAYLLESCHADYPRMLIGDELWNFLRVGLAANEHGATPASRFLKELIGREMGLTTEDGDGRRILDYLCPAVRSLYNPSQAANVIQPAYLFVVNQQKHWRSVENTTLSERYSKLRMYFESRISSWGITPTQS